MKTATLIAVIAIGLQLVAGLYYLLQFYQVIDYNRSVHEIIQPLYVLSDIGLLVFFINLYNKQTKS